MSYPSTRTAAAGDRGGGIGVGGRWYGMLWLVTVAGPEIGGRM